MKKLRRKIIVGVSISALAVFALTILLFALTYNIQLTHRADALTGLIEKYEGKLPPKSEYERLTKDEQIRLYAYDEESPYRVRYFIVYLDDENGWSADTEHIAAVDEQTAFDMAQSVVLIGETLGYSDDFRYRVTEDGAEVIFLDASQELSGMWFLLLAISVIALAFVLMITVVFFFLSRRIVRPFEENSRMQKQFITDASHELKTPLAIISANAEVLAYKDGENEWIGNITAQVERIGGLINELLTLNRLEEVDSVVDIEPVDLSELTREVASEFDEVFKSRNAAVSYDLQSGVVISGNRDQLSRLISVLTENASKYVSENGEVRIGLKKELRYTVLSVYNTCETDPSVDYSHLFDRFYRPDSSRTSSTGGHGVGLSIAKRIAVLHNGSIEALPEKDGLTFRVRLSNHLK